MPLRDAGEAIAADRRARTFAPFVPVTRAGGAPSCAGTRPRPRPASRHAPHVMPSSARRLRLAALAVLPLTACKKGDAVAPRTASALIMVQGDGQQRQAYRKLPTPLVFRATDDAAQGVANVPLTVVVDQGGGAVDSASLRTDGNGEARVRWTLGGTPAQALVASAPGVRPVRATATALLPTDVVIVQGNNQTARAGASLPVPVIVRVLGPGNVAMDSVPVTLQIASGGGSIAPQTVVTNATGEATVRWTMGASGANTTYVRVGTLDPVVLNATAAP